MNRGIDAERSILGAILLKPELLPGLTAAGLQPSDFSLPSHHDIYKVVLAMHRADTPIDSVTLFHELVQRGQLDNVGGVAYISDLTTGCVPVLKHILYHAALVMTAARLSRIQKIGERACEAAGRPGTDPAKLAQAICSQLQGVGSGE